MTCIIIMGHIILKSDVIEDIIELPNGTQYPLDDYSNTTGISVSDLISSADEVITINATDEPKIGQECADLLEELWSGDFQL